MHLAEAPVVPSPIPDDVIERELRYAAALGVVVSFDVSRRAASTGSYRRWIVRTSDGDAHPWTPAQVVAFTTGVRLATERKGT